MKAILAATALAMAAHPAWAETLPDPDATLIWVFTEMTCGEYLGSFTEHDGITRGAIAKQVAMAYQKGLADARGTDSAMVGAKISLACARNPDARFIDAATAN